MKTNIFIFLLVIAMNSIPVNLFSQQIIADHTVVDKYKDIPQYYIDNVKEMWVTIPGESHSSAYRIGCQLLASLDSVYKVNITESGTPEGYTIEHLRLSRATWGDISNAAGWRYGYGEEDWYTSMLSKTRTKNHLSYCNTNNLTIAAMGFGWCWDMTWTNSPGGGIDEDYKVKWAGSSDGGTQGDLRWGLDANDSVLTGNSVCMDTYLNATTEYINHCIVNNYPTKIFFTTGPVDGGGNKGESGYQRHLKHQYIRDYVQASTDRMLFDYADILCWSNAGVQQTTTWTDRGGVLQTFQCIHSDNMLDLNGTYTEDGDHIGERGAVRLAKALWWFLARIAGWDGTIAGIDQTENRSEYMHIWPNPVNDILTIQFAETNKNSNVTLFSINGLELMKQSINDNLIQFDLSKQADAVYIIKFVNDNTNEVRKIIKK